MLKNPSSCICIEVQQANQTESFRIQEKCTKSIKMLCRGSDSASVTVLIMCTLSYKLTVMRR